MIYYSTLNKYKIIVKHKSVAREPLQETKHFMQNKMYDNLLQKEEAVYLQAGSQNWLE